MTTRQVSVSRETRDLTFLDTEGNEVPLGTVGVDEFEGEGVRKLVFYPSEQNPWVPSAKKREEGYSLGVGSSALDVLNPADAQRVLVDQGWKAYHQFGIGGGWASSMIYALPSEEFDDPIKYDREIWGERGTKNSLMPMVNLRMSLTTGRMCAEYNVGIYRLICTNGVVSPLLDLPAYRFSHRDWSIDNVVQSLSSETAFPVIRELPRGPEVADPRHLTLASKYLRRYLEDQTNPEGKSESSQILERAFPIFSPSSTSPWALENYLDQLDLLLSGHSGGAIHALDLVLAYTSGVNLQRHRNGNDRGAYWAFESQNRVIESTRSLAEMAVIFSDN